MSNERFALGFMTGTSMDGLDAASIRATGTGEDLQVELVRHVHRPWPASLEGLRAFAHGQAQTAAEIRRHAHRLGRLHADVMREHFADLRPDLVAVHGQTVHHAPPTSWQLIDPWPILGVAECPIVTDLRGADLLAGGEGAPITPCADAILFRDHVRPDSTLAIVNLGGFANVTLLPSRIPTEAIGFDCCPCNHLLDAASRRGLARPFDEDGRATAAGTSTPSLVSALLPTLRRLLEADRSGGDGDDAIEQTERMAMDALADDRVEDLMASMARAIATIVVEAIQDRLRRHRLPPVDRLLLAGGGVLNAGLVNALASAPMTPEAASVETLDAIGIPPDAREAADLAVLGLLAFDGFDITTPASTRRNAGLPKSGIWIG